MWAGWLAEEEYSWPKGPIVPPGMERGGRAEKGGGFSSGQYATRSFVPASSNRTKEAAIER